MVFRLHVVDRRLPVESLKVPYYRPRSGSPANRPFPLDPFSSFLIVPAPKGPLSRPLSGVAADRSSPSWLIFISFFPVAYMPQGFNVTDFRTGFTAHRVRRFLSLFSVYLVLGFNDTDSRHGFSACPDFAVHRPFTFDPAFDLVLAYVCMCLLFPYYHRSRLPHYVSATEWW